MSRVLNRLGLYRDVMGATLTALRRRSAGTPLHADWPLWMEAAQEALRRQNLRAFRLAGAKGEGMERSRAVVDSVRASGPVLRRVPVARDTLAGRPARRARPEKAVRHALFLHGGGYAYFAKAHDGLIAGVAEALAADTWAPDYRLIPEHPWPAQLDDALAAYDALLAQGIAPGRLVVAGDSAGGHLVLALLLALRDGGRPLPGCAVALCPWTDTDPARADTYPSVRGNARSDWISAPMAERWARWLRSQAPDHPYLSPVSADWHGMPPLLVQAGTAEILIDMITAFVDNARRFPDSVVEYDAVDGMPP
nr:lipase [uncultured bacterium]